MPRIELINKDMFLIGADTFVQQVNCQGVMGSGLALTIKEKFPEVYDAYKAFCETYTPEELLGRIQVVEVVRDDKTYYIVNIFGQLNYGREKGYVYTNYKALEQGMSLLNNYLQINSNRKVVIPYQIGCSLGQGNWNKVRDIIIEKLSPSARNIRICSVNKITKGFKYVDET